MGAAGGSKGDIRDPVEAERLRTLAPAAFHTRRDLLQRILFLARRRLGRHRLTIRVLSGVPALEGLAIGSRRA